MTVWTVIFLFSKESIYDKLTNGLVIYNKIPGVATAGFCLIG